MSDFSKRSCGRELKQAEIRRVQTDMLDALAKLCDDNGLRYYLSGGTLLGAVRHKGFIPWDDDIDINMPRPDVEALERLSALPEGCELVRGGADPYSPACQWYRLYNKGYIIENFHNGSSERPFYHPLFIDIFPIDGFPEDERETNRFSKKLILIRKFLGVSWHRGIIAKNRREYAAHLLAEIPAKIVGYERWCRMFQTLARKYAFDESKYVGVTTTVQYLPREKVLKADYLPYVDLEFEGKYYHAPKNYDVYLTQLYREYMKLPPESKRVSGHVFHVYRRK